jgi:hypothetical protein
MVNPIFWLPCKVLGAALLSLEPPLRGGGGSIVYTKAPYEFCRTYKNGDKLWGAGDALFCKLNGQNYRRNRKNKNFNEIVKKLNNGHPYEEPPYFQKLPSEKKIVWGSEGFKNFKTENAKNTIENFSAKYKNGSEYWIKEGVRSCKLDGQIYSDQKDVDFYEIVERLNNKNPYPGNLKPFQHFFKNKLQGEKNENKELYQKLLKKFNKKTQEKIDRLMISLLKAVKKQGFGFDKLYEKFNKVLEKDDLKLKNMTKKIKEGMADLNH